MYNLCKTCIYKDNCVDSGNITNCDDHYSEEYEEAMNEMFTEILRIEFYKQWEEYVGCQV